MVKRARTFLSVLVAIFCTSAARPEPVRFALIIGNSTYTHTVPLPNAAGDARKLATHMKRLGFEVQEKTIDLDARELRDAVRQFGARLKRAGPNDVGFFYYAGHAAQDSSGVNYLIPTDAVVSSPDSLRQSATALQPLLADMENADNDVNIVILDACRDWFSGHRSDGTPRGLHDMGRHASVLISYATGADQVADEGNTESSPYSRRLIEAIQHESSEPVALLFDDVQSRVYSDTDSGQSPLYVNGLARAGRWNLARLPGRSQRRAALNSPPPPMGFLSTLDRAKLMQFSRGKQTFVDALFAHRSDLKKSRIDTPQRLAFFLAEIGYETGGHFRGQLENMKYSPQQILAKFPSRVTDLATAERFSGKPEELANYIFAGRFGNGSERSGDGWKYRGRGLFDLVGKDRYRKYRKVVGVDLLQSPELLSDTDNGLIVAAALWNDRKANDAADKGDLALVSQRVRGTASEIGERDIWLRQAKKALGI